jgi:hypothetical protein
VSYVLQSLYLKKIKKTYYLSFIINVWLNYSIVYKILDSKYYSNFKSFNIGFKSLYRSLILFINFFYKTKKKLNKYIQSIIFYKLASKSSIIESFDWISTSKNKLFLLHKKNYVFKLVLLIYFFLNKYSLFKFKNDSNINMFTNYVILTNLYSTKLLKTQIF